MERHLLEDEQGYPWTASAPLGWAVFLYIGSSGVLLCLVALYLAAWIFTKGRHWSLVGFLVSETAILIAISFGHWHLIDGVTDWLFTFACLLFVVSSFVLRHEIKQHYRVNEGWNIEIGPWFTLFFTVGYINYCLNPVRLEHKDSVTSLNLNG